MEPPLIRLLKRFGLDFHAIGGLVDYHGLRQPCVARLSDLIEQVRGESRTLWLYAQDEVSRYAELKASGAARITEREAAVPSLED